MILFITLVPVLVTGVVCLILDLHFLRLGNISKKQERVQKTDDLPPATILITTQNEEDLLRKNLPLFLKQEYSIGYEVVIVDIRSKDNTLDYLSELENYYPNLHHTSIPESARDISLDRLALSLGFKSATFEWVVLTKIDCQPCNNKWLSRLMLSCTSDKSVVLGMTQYISSGKRVSKQMFYKLWNQMLWLPYARFHSPTWADGSCLCYRRSKFFSHHGFASHANLTIAAEILMVNLQIRRNECTINTDPKAEILQDTPNIRQWRKERIIDCEANRHTQNAFLYHIWKKMCSIWPLAYTILTIVMIVLYIHDMWVVGISATLWLIHVIVSYCCFRYTSRQVGYPCSFLFMPFYALMMPLWEIQTGWSHFWTDKKAFQKKHI